MWLAIFEVSFFDSTVDPAAAAYTIFFGSD
jgi:hypothetical protein